MNILGFVKALLPRLDKEKVVEDLRITISELNEVIIPNFQNASDYFRSAKFLSDDNKDLSDSFYRKFDNNGIPKQPNFVSEIAKRLPNVKANAEWLREQIENILEKDVISEGLTAKKAILIRTAEHISFLSRFSADVLNYVYVQEANAIGTDVDESMALAPGARKMVESRFSIYASMVSNYGMNPKDFEKQFVKVPDVVINSRTENSIVGIYKESDIDPFTVAYVSGFTGNPIYHVRLLVAEYQANRYKANKDKKRMLELRLLHLQFLKENKGANPKIQQEIEYIQNRVERISRYLREVEENYEMEA